MRVATYARTERANAEDKQIHFYVQVGISLAPRHEQLRSLLLSLAVAGLAVFLVALAMAALFTQQWFQGVRALGATARQLSAETLAKQRVFVSSEDIELASVAEAFNALLDRLDEAKENQERFVSDASHELRTPLTILHGEIEVALRRPRDPEEYRSTLKSALEEIKRMFRLVENLLALAHADRGHALAGNEPVEWASVVRAVVGRLAPFASALEVELVIEGDPEILVSGDGLALDRVAFNLVENAIHHSPKGESVTVRLHAEGSDGFLEVIDHGPGIAAENLPHLFERFYRLDKARSRGLGGAGLGLAIVRALVQAHQGEVCVESQIGVGSRFQVRLPLDKAVRKAGLGTGGPAEIQREIALS